MVSARWYFLLMLTVFIYTLFWRQTRDEAKNPHGLHSISDCSERSAAATARSCNTFRVKCGFASDIKLVSIFPRERKKFHIFQDWQIFRETQTESCIRSSAQCGYSGSICSSPLQRKFSCYETPARAPFETRHYTLNPVVARTASVLVNVGETQPINLCLFWTY